MSYRLTRSIMMPCLTLDRTQSVLPLNLVAKSMGYLSSVQPFTLQVLHVKRLSSRILYNPLTKTTESWTRLKFLGSSGSHNYFPILNVQNFHQGSQQAP